MKAKISPEEPINILKRVFDDQPELLHLISLSDIESEEHIKAFTQQQLFEEPIRLYVVGRVSSGKTSLGNRLLNADLMRSTGYMDCTRSLGILRLKSNLIYIDTPGAGSDERFENITRAALLLPQTEDSEVNEFEVADYTNAKIQNAQVVNTQVFTVTTTQWQSNINHQQYEPDIILYLVAPHRLFLKDDRKFLTSLLKVHKQKVIVALNIFTADGDVEMPTTQNIEDTKQKIQEVYNAVDRSLQCRMITIHALSGSGINELTKAICEILPKSKLGAIKSALSEKLQKIAEQERQKRYRRVIYHLAARLALHRIDQKVGNQELITVAARGISQYGIMTFTADQETVKLRDNLTDLIKSEIEQIKVQRTEVITTKQVIERERNIERPVAKKQKFEVKIDKPVLTKGTIYSREKKGGIELLVAKLFGGSTTKLVETQGDIVKFVSVTEVEERIVGYEMEYVETVREVVDTIEKTVDKRPLEGGVPLIEFLIGLGLGIEATYSSANNPLTTLPSNVKEQQQWVQIALRPVVAQIERLIKSDGNEEELLNLLANRLDHKNQG